MKCPRCIAAEPRSAARFQFWGGQSCVSLAPIAIFAVGVEVAGLASPWCSFVGFDAHYSALAWTLS